MFARTTRGHGRGNGGRLLRFEIVVSGPTSALIIRIKMQADENILLGAASVISRPVICQVSSAGKHFLQLKTFVWNTSLFAVCGLTRISTEDSFSLIPYCDS